MMKQEFVEKQIARLEGIVQNGLNPVYTDFNDYMHDFYPNYSWNRDDAIEEFMATLIHPKFELINQQIMEKFNYDLRHDLNLAIVMTKNHDI